jgi:hypothetical protein
LKELISLLYQGCCNGITGKRFFNAPPLEDILADLGEWLGK